MSSVLGEDAPRIPANATAPTRIDQYPNDFAKLRRVFERHAKDGELRSERRGIRAAANEYRAHPTAFVIQQRTVRAPPGLEVEGESQAVIHLFQQGG